jgi:hypothetical protein
MVWATNNTGIKMLIGPGKYSGGYAGYLDAQIDPFYVDYSGYSQPDYFYSAPPLLPPIDAADPVDMVDGTFQVESDDLSLVPGTTIDRFGIASGSYVSPTGTPFIQRSLAPGTQYAPYNIYNVLKPIDVQAGPIAPAFGMPGGGMQYKLPSPVQSLIDSGHLGLGN